MSLSIADKKEKLARAMYEHYRMVSDEVIARSFDYLDADEKFNWLSMVDVALEEIRKVEPFQKEAIVEGYRTRGLFCVPDGMTWDEAISDFFEYGYAQALDAYYDVPDEASNGFS